MREWYWHANKAGPIKTHFHTKTVLHSVHKRKAIHDDAGSLETNRNTSHKNNGYIIETRFVNAVDELVMEEQTIAKPIISAQTCTTVRSLAGYTYLSPGLHASSV